MFRQVSHSVPDDRVEDFPHMFLPKRYFEVLEFEVLGKTPVCSGKLSGSVPGLRHGSTTKKFYKRNYSIKLSLTNFNDREKWCPRGNKSVFHRSQRDLQKP